MTSEVFNMDCMDYMKQLPNNFFSLCIADPPYGLIESGVQTRGGAGKLKGRILNKSEKKFDRWDKKPTQNFFDELFRVCDNVIIWGGELLRPATDKVLYLLG